MDDIHAHRIKKQFETSYSETTGFIRCFTQTTKYDYIDESVQLAWMIYLKGRSHANQHIKKMLKACHREEINLDN